MTTTELVRGLEKVRKQHEYDNVSPFDTNWCDILDVVIKHVVELQRQIDDMKYADQMAEAAREIHDEEKKNREVDIPVYKEWTRKEASDWEGEK